MVVAAWGGDPARTGPVEARRLRGAGLPSGADWASCSGVRGRRGGCVGSASWLPLRASLHLELPPTEVFTDHPWRIDSTPHDWFIAVHSADGWGHFVFKVGMPDSGAPRVILVGTDFDMLEADSPFTTGDLEEYLIGSVKAYFSASEGSSFPTRFIVFNDDPRCGRSWPSNDCNLIIEEHRTRSRAAIRVKLAPERVRRRRYFTLAHEWFHLLSHETLFDEYKRRDGVPYVQCGHTVMARSMTGHFRTLCRCANHGLDHEAHVSSMGGRSGWAELGRWNLASPDALFFFDHPFGDVLTIARRGY